MNIHIKNGRLFDPIYQLDAVKDLFIKDKIIESLDKKPKGFKADIVIDAKDKLVIPGVIDLCARLREPGQEYKATFESECKAANASGITTICCPPDTKPVIDTTAVIDLIQQRANQTNRSNVLPLAAITLGLNGDQLSEMHTLKNAGCVGVSNALTPIENTEVLRRAFEYANSCDMTVFFFAEDTALKNNGVAHEGALSTRMGLPAIPETAETVALSRALLLVEQTGVRAHFCRISSARGVKLIRDAQQEGLPVTADVAITHLHLTDMDIADYNNNCHLQPPLRSERDRQALIDGLNDGTISAVCSDHQPHDMDAKSAPFSQTEPGASTIEHLLPLMLHLVDRDAIKLETAISVLTSQASQVLELEKGTLNEGSDADVCIVDLDASQDIDINTLISAGKNTPFNGWELPGVVSSYYL